MNRDTAEAAYDRATWVVIVPDDTDADTGRAQCWTDAGVTEIRVRRRLFEAEGRIFPMWVIAEEGNHDE